MTFWTTAAVGAMLAVAGCTMAAQQRDNLLTDAGFTRVSTDTPEWTAAMRTLPPHRFAHRTVNGTPMVFWSDPVACKCVYSGTQAAFEAYRQVHREEAAAFDESVGGGSSFSR
jgi:hypothetical protein